MIPERPAVYSPPERVNCFSSCTPSPQIRQFQCRLTPAMSYSVISSRRRRRSAMTSFTLRSGGRRTRNLRRLFPSLAVSTGLAGGRLPACNVLCCGCTLFPFSRRPTASCCHALSYHCLCTLLKGARKC